MQYSCAGLRVGCYVSIFTILLGTLLVILRRREVLFYKKQRTEKWNALADAPDTPTSDEKSEIDNFISEYLDLDVIVEDKKKDPPEEKE